MTQSSPSLFRPFAHGRLIALLAPAGGWSAMGGPGSRTLDEDIRPRAWHRPATAEHAEVSREAPAAPSVTPEVATPAPAFSSLSEGDVLEALEGPEGADSGAFDEDEDVDDEDSYELAMEDADWDEDVEDEHTESDVPAVSVAPSTPARDDQVFELFSLSA